MAIEATSDRPQELVLPGASRATIVLGFASIGGLVGFVVATWLAASMLGLELPDRVPEYMPFLMMAGAGIGWVVGVGLGWIAGYRGRGAGSRVRRLADVGAAAVVIGAVLIVIWPVRTGWPDTHVEFFWAWHTWGEGGKGGPAFVAVTVLDALVAASTLIVMSRDRGVEAPWPRRVAGLVGVIGLVVGATAFVLGVALVPLTWPGDVGHRQTKAVYRTTESLVAAVAEHEDRTGEFPSTLAQVLAAGGRLRPGTQVEFLGEVDGSICLRVGIDAGVTTADDPHYSALVHRRPRGAKSWTSSEVWLGNSCRDPA
jgi:hypothetical protein